MALTPEIKKWVKDQKAAGYTTAQLIDSLRKQGWTEEDITTLFPPEKVAPPEIPKEEGSLLLDKATPSLEEQTPGLGEEDALLASASTDDSLLAASTDDSFPADDYSAEPMSYGEEEPAKKSLPIVPIVIVVVLIAAVGGYFMFFTGEEVVGGTTILDTLDNEFGNYLGGEETWQSSTAQFLKAERVNANEFAIGDVNDLILFCENTSAFSVSNYCKENFEAIAFPDDLFDCSEYTLEALKDYDNKLSFCCDDDGYCIMGIDSTDKAFEQEEPTPEPTPEANATVTPEPTPEATPTPEPTPTPEANATVTPTPGPTPTPEPTPVPGEDPLNTMADVLDKASRGGIVYTSTDFAQFLIGQEITADDVAAMANVNLGQAVFCCGGSYGSADSECVGYEFTGQTEFDCPSDGAILTVTGDITEKVRAYCPVNGNQCIIGFGS